MTTSTNNAPDTLSTKILNATVVVILIAAGVVGRIVFAAAFWGWKNISETYGKNLNYEEV